jgi:hypothetical protein
VIFRSATKSCRGAGCSAVLQRRRRETADEWRNRNLCDVCVVRGTPVAGRTRRRLPKRLRRTLGDAVEEHPLLLLMLAGRELHDAWFPYSGRA